MTSPLSKATDTLKSEALPERQARPEGEPLFRLVEAATTGIDLVHRWDPPTKHRDQLTNAFCGGGVAIGDYNADGLPDVFISGQAQGGRLYQNRGDFRFQDETGILSPPPPAGTWSTGAAWADVDNDGWLDLYVCGFDCPNRLYLNRPRAEGSGRHLVESARALGVAFSGASVMGSFADYDRDGDLDLFLLTNRLPAPDSLRNERFSLTRDAQGKPVLPDAFREYADLIVLPGNQGYKRIDAGQYDHLYRNEGPGKPFRDVTGEVGMSGNHYGLSATWWDWNRDGWPDLYVANDFFGPDQLWTNNGPDANGKITFTDQTPSALPHTPWFSMGSDIADINNDGLVDLLATDMAGSTHYSEKMQMGNMSGPDSDAWFLNFPKPPQYMRNALYLNTGTLYFKEVADLLGVSKTDWTWSVNFGDLDNDGREDLLVTNGMSRDWLNSDLKATAPSKDGWDRYYDFWYAQPPLKQTNRAFHNAGDFKMEEVGQRWGLNQNNVSFGAALSDLDQDGDLDAVVHRFGETPALYQNRGHEGHRFAIQLRGKKSNPFGLGATVTATFGNSGEKLTRYLTSARGFMSSPDPVLHFGTGRHEVVDELTIDWPSGHRQVLRQLPVNQVHTLSEPDEPSPSIKESPKPLFVASQAFQRMRHQERPFDDFARQPLLPNKLSQLGPALAFADVDGDGAEDFYLGQGAGIGGQLYFRNKPPSTAPFAPHAASEDLAATFFDVEGDGDLDLHVVSGGVEGEPGDPVFQDRLYLNDGAGNFSHHPAALPPIAISGKAAAAADFDRDGDVDLFVGGRVIPGRYPQAPASQLLVNDSKGERIQFRDVASAHALHSLGMVTAAVWADVNGDEWPDLVTATEWGRLRLFLNREGKLEDTTSKQGFAKDLGLWSALAIGDLDQDGDLDIVAGNLGFNTKYKATPEKPELLFYGDVDGGGQPRILEAKYEGDRCLPRRGYSCSSNAMPSLRNRLTNFHAFASRSLESIYTPTRLQSAERFEANTLATCLYLNDGEGAFGAALPLPRLAQSFPVFGIAIHDFTKDGHPDIYLIGNSNSPQRETGNMDGGVSLLLRGAKDPENGLLLEPVWPNESGLVVRGDAKALIVTDLNGDQRQDVVVGINQGSLQGFLAQ